MLRLACGVWNDCLWIELSWHQFKQNESGFYWKEYTCLIRMMSFSCDWGLIITW